MKRIFLICFIIITPIILSACNSASPDPTNQNDTTPPIISVQNKELDLHGIFNPYDLVLSYSDDQDTNPILSIENNTVNVESPGNYQVLFKITDKSGNFATALSQVTVLSANQMLTKYFESSNLYDCKNGNCISADNYITFPSGIKSNAWISYNIALSKFTVNIYDWADFDNNKEIELTFDLKTGVIVYNMEEDYGTSPNWYHHEIDVTYNAYTRDVTYIYTNYNLGGSILEESTYNLSIIYIEAFITKIAGYLDYLKIDFSDFS